jgi:phage FluMu protein Com
MKLLQKFKKRLEYKFEKSKDNQNNKKTKATSLITKSNLGDEDAFLFI